MHVRTLQDFVKFSGDPFCVTFLNSKKQVGILFQISVLARILISLFQMPELDFGNHVDRRWWIIANKCSRKVGPIRCVVTATAP